LPSGRASTPFGFYARVLGPSAPPTLLARLGHEANDALDELPI